MIVAARLVGADNEHMEFIIPSFTEKNAEYSLFVSKRDGSIICNCMDASCGSKMGQVMNPTNSTALTCKHIRRLQHQFGEALKP